MKNINSDNYTSKDLESQEVITSKINSSLKKELYKLRKNVESLNYEESLKKLDLLLNELKSDSIPVEDLQRCYLESTIYLEHCEKLLNLVEQEIIEINTDDLKT